MTEIIDCRKIAKDLERNLKAEIDQFYQIHDFKPSLHTILIGGDEASKIYSRSKIKAAERVGMTGEVHTLPENVSISEVLELIDNLNNDQAVNGLMIEMPVPKTLDSWKILARVDPEKDIDGMNPVNYGKLLIGKEENVPSTPKAIITILEKEKIEFEGLNVCIINRTPVVGKPLALMLLNRHATVTVCHSKTKNLKDYTQRADVVVVAVGKPRFLKEDMVAENAVVIDVGINSEGDKIVGDADFEVLKNKVKKITPVPGGVGSVTTMTILQNTMNAAKRMIQ